MLVVTTAVYYTGSKIMTSTINSKSESTRQAGVWVKPDQVTEADGLSPVPDMESRSLVAVGVTILLTVVVLSWLVVGLFPASLAQGGTVTNIFAHAAGFLYGEGLAAGLRR